MKHMSHFVSTLRRRVKIRDPGKGQSLKTLRCSSDLEEKKFLQRIFLSNILVLRRFIHLFIHLLSITEVLPVPHIII